MSNPLPKILLWPSIVASAIGLVLSVLVHVCAWSGRVPLGGSTSALHLGIFFVWLPAVLVARQRSRGRAPKSLDEALAGAPQAMIWMTKAFFAYAFAHFILSIASPRALAFLGTAAVPDEARSARIFSGHWMLFYSIALTLLVAGIGQTTSAAAARQGPGRCTAGHSMGEGDEFCRRCGALPENGPVAGTPSG